MAPDASSKAALIGHSFTRRLREAFGFRREITTRHDARQFARLLKVDHVFEEVYTITYKDGAKLAGVFDLPTKDFVQRLGITHVVVDVVSNDLARRPSLDPVFITKIAEFVMLWAAELGVKTVIQKCLPRLRNIAATPEEFQRMADAYNDIIRTRVDARTGTTRPGTSRRASSREARLQAIDRRDPNHRQFSAVQRVRYNKMQGFTVQSWPSVAHPDGIHVARPRGLYLQRVRTSLLGFLW